MKEKKDGILTITLEGRLDAVTAPKLPEEVENEEYEKLIFDMQKLEYISSAGLRAILLCKKISDGKGAVTIIRKPTVAVLDVLKMCGFATILEIEED